MSAPSSAPRAEKPGRLGASWETELRWTGEQVATDDRPEPRPNRATRRAAARARRNR